MRIKVGMFDYGGEVDITSDFPSERVWPRGRLSIRRADDGEYEAYVHWFESMKEEVLYQSYDLKDVVRYTNKFVDWEDVVE